MIDPSARDRGRLKMLIRSIAQQWTHPYDVWCVELFLATTAAKDTYMQVKRDRRVSREKWKQDLAEGRRLVREAVRPGGKLDAAKVRRMLLVKHPPEW